MKLLAGERTVMMENVFSCCKQRASRWFGILKND